MVSPKWPPSVVDEKLFKVPSHVLAIERFPPQVRFGPEKLPGRWTSLLKTNSVIERTVSVKKICWYLQMHKERMGLFSIDPDLPCQRKLWNKGHSTLHAWPDILHAVEDLCGILPRLLKAKLMTRECQDVKGFLLVFVGKGVQCVVLRGVPSEGGHINHQEDFAKVVRNAYVPCPMNIFNHKVVGAIDD